MTPVGDAPTKRGPIFDAFRTGLRLPNVSRSSARSQPSRLLVRTQLGGLSHFRLT